MTKSKPPPSFAPETGHAVLFDNAPIQMAFQEEDDFSSWQQDLRTKLRELLGIANFRKVEPNLRIEDEKEEAEFLETRFTFSSEEQVEVPCHLLLPKTGSGPFPVLITLQGHSTGMHLSLGRAKFDGDEESLKGDRDFGVQAVRQGYAALVIEQRCFGEREDQRPKDVHPAG